MKKGDLVHPFFEQESNTIGIVLSKDCEQYYRILIRRKVYSIPRHQIREIK